MSILADSFRSNPHLICLFSAFSSFPALFKVALSTFSSYSNALPFNDTTAGKRTTILKMVCFLGIFFSHHHYFRIGVPQVLNLDTVAANIDVDPLGLDSFSVDSFDKLALSESHKPFMTSGRKVKEEDKLVLFLRRLLKDALVSSTMAYEFEASPSSEFCFVHLLIQYFPVL